MTAAAAVVADAAAVIDRPLCNAQFVHILIGSDHQHEAGSCRLHSRNISAFCLRFFALLRCVRARDDKTTVLFINNILLRCNL